MGVYYYLVESKNIHNGLLFHENTIFLENKLLLVQMHFFQRSASQPPWKIQVAGAQFRLYEYFLAYGEDHYK